MHLSLPALLLLLCPIAIHAQEQTRYSRRNSLALTAEASRTSSHILLGSSQIRRLAGLRLTYSRRLLATRHLDWHYDFALRPIFFLGDPSATTSTFFELHFPFISNPLPGGYSFPDYDQYDRLERAYALDQHAALKATSWGAFQILGENFSDAGHPSVESFVRAMCSSVEEQGDAFVAFIKADAVKLKALQQKDWATFARRYNGPTYKKNKYDTTLQRNYDASTE